RRKNPSGAFSIMNRPSLTPKSNKPLAQSFDPPHLSQPGHALYGRLAGQERERSRPRQGGGQEPRATLLAERLPAR
ncbi:MAG: hypothetical protein KDM63_09555, partial [Verrucomicrobiae bacterium]|nr:hypothetical protein [Verrucomicrobiae bacterium]